MCVCACVYPQKPGTMKALLERGANPVAVTVAEDVNDIVKCPRWTTPLHVAGYNGERVKLHTSHASMLLKASVIRPVAARAARAAGPYKPPARTLRRASQYVELCSVCVCMCVSVCRLYSGRQGAVGSLPVHT